VLKRHSLCSVVPALGGAFSLLKFLMNSFLRLFWEATKSTSLLVLLLPALLLSMSAAVSSTPIVREEGVIYLSDFLNQPTKLPLRERTECFFNKEMDRHAGTLRFPQTVEVLAIYEEVCRVRGMAQQGQVVAWIPIKAVDGLTPERLAELRAMDERQRMIEKLIANNEVAIGMTIDEVRRSLGRPQRVTNQANADGTVQILEYIQYQTIVRQVTVNTPLGPILQNVTERVPVGTMKIRCKDNIVIELEKTES